MGGRADMDLRKKALIVLTAVIIGIIVIFLAISFTYFLDNYRKIETIYITDYSNLVNQNMHNEIYNLDVIVKDWGPWDDTYEFAAGKKPDYVQTNLIVSTYQYLNLDFIMITNTQGEVLYAQEYDSERNELIPLRPDLVAESARGDSPFRNMDINNRSNGFLNLPEGMVIFSSYPIVHSDFNGTPRGVFIMGRYVDEKVVAKLSLATRPKISIIPIGQASLSDRDLAQLTGANNTPVLIRTLDDETIEGDRVIADASGKKNLILRVQIPRDIYQQGKRDILNFIYIQLGILLITGLSIIWLLDSQVFSRLASLNTEIEGITLRKNGESRITSTGNDEISHVTLAMNRMLDQIDKDQQDLRVREQYFREFAEQFPQILLEVDSGGHPTFISRTAYEKFGYSPEDLDENTTLYQFISPEEHPRAQENFSRVLDGRTLSGNEYMAVKKDGSRFPVLLYSAPVIRDEKPVGMRVFAGDISDRKQMENALLETNKKLNLLNSITRHDVRNQLAVIYGFMSLIDETIADPQTKSYMDSLKKAAETVRHQIDFTKDYQDIGVNAPQWQNVRQVILNANGNHFPSHYKILIDIHGVEIYADILLERVFFNLVDNANRYAGKISELRLTGREVPEGFLITCEDDGTGIPSGKKEAIFKRQYFRNTGFGLFLSREILAITGITIRETGEPGKGARFEILVPKGGYRFTKTGDATESRN